MRRALFAAVACATAQVGWPQVGWSQVGWSQATAPQIATGEAASGQAVSKPEIAPFGRGSFDAIRKAHAGRPLIVHFWSVTCSICVAELADWAKLARETSGVDFVFVNADPESDRHRALSRMEKAGLRQAANFAFADRFVERLYFEVDQAWAGELPFTALVAANGRLVTEIGALSDLKLASWLADKAER
ncbi:TlpA family protein disulfide reductase [Methylosinus sporium]|uniref:TlpA family protein disulfide reductase n=2 Tax=Methylocystaceae TaxID=31993 RepID=A0A549T4P2_METSR|nr:TlpA family protein disulfide reductase [Methylosinus sp. KRF6]TRL36837.1 TlpA family protein disulfide reductase [Methylosinus sporium]